MNLLKSHLIIGFLFCIQIVSMGAMEMSGPFGLFIYNIIARVGYCLFFDNGLCRPYDWCHVNSVHFGEEWVIEWVIKQ
ncbi:hypothetical protein AB6F62_07965 [Providencia huaxiensis]|uniref:hypothetical protein n=1 Tax=Providencia huaxiensis TaxID=2027290 RepID=UPI0034DDAB22